MGSAPIGISGSRSAGILGVSKYTTPLNVFCQIVGEEKCEKLGIKYEPFTGNESTEMGLYFEDAICHYAEINERSLLERPDIRVSRFDVDGKEFLCRRDVPLPVKPDCYDIGTNIILTCHPDGFFNYGPIYSAKTANNRAFWNEWTDTTVPIAYQSQAQHEMIVNWHIEKVVLYALIFPDAQAEYLSGGRNGKIALRLLKDALFMDDVIDPMQWTHVLWQMGRLKRYEIPRDKKVQQKMLKKYYLFYENHIKPCIPPDPETYDDCKMLFHQPVGTILCTPEIESLLIEHKEIGKEIGNGGSLKKRREQIKVEALKYAFESEKPVDPDSADKWIFMSESGEKIGSYNGKTFR